MASNDFWKHLEDLQGKKKQSRRKKLTYELPKVSSVGSFDTYASSGYSTSHMSRTPSLGSVRSTTYNPDYEGRYRISRDDPPGLLTHMRAFRNSTAVSSCSSGSEEEAEYYIRRKLSKLQINQANRTIVKDNVPLSEIHQFKMQRPIQRHSYQEPSLRTNQRLPSTQTYDSGYHKAKRPEFYQHNDQYNELISNSEAVLVDKNADAKDKSPREVFRRLSVNSGNAVPYSSPGCGAMGKRFSSWSQQVLNYDDFGEDDTESANNECSMNLVSPDEFNEQDDLTEANAGHDMNDSFGRSNEPFLRSSSRPEFFQEPQRRNFLRADSWSESQSRMIKKPKFFNEPEELYEQGYSNSMHKSFSSPALDVYGRTIPRNRSAESIYSRSTSVEPEEERVNSSARTFQRSVSRRKILDSLFEEPPNVTHSPGQAIAAQSEMATLHKRTRKTGQQAMLSRASILSSLLSADNQDRANHGLLLKTVDQSDLCDRTLASDKAAFDKRMGLDKPDGLDKTIRGLNFDTCSSDEELEACHDVIPSDEEDIFAVRENANLKKGDLNPGPFGCVKKGVTIMLFDFEDEGMLLGIVFYVDS